MKGASPLTPDCSWIAVGGEGRVGGALWGCKGGVLECLEV